MSNLVSQRRSTAAIVLKHFESMLRKPTAGSQFIALQPDFSLNPNFTTTENIELKDDIMSGKNIVTGEAPGGTLSHYFTGSGKPGVAPEYGPILQTTFGGYRALPAEVMTVAGSTRSILKFSEGNAAMFTKGDGMLIKDNANGWALRPVESVNGDEVTLGFQLSAAPAAGVGTSQYVTYFPLNDNLPVFDIWHYLGGGESGVETIANCRTTSLTINATAKDLINSTFNFEGTDYGFNEEYVDNLTLFESNNTFRLISEKSKAGELVTLEAKKYENSDGDPDPAALAAEFQAKVRRVTGYSAATMSYSATTKKFTFTSTKGYNLDFYSEGGGNPSLAKILGYKQEDVLDNDLRTGAFTSPNTLFLTRDYRHGLTEVYDDADPIIARGQRLFIGDLTDNICIDSSSVTINIGTPRSLITSICEESGNYASLINARMATISVSAHLQDDDRRFFDKFQDGDDIRFAFMAGRKDRQDDGTFQWKAGESFIVYGSPASITNWNITSSNEVYMLDLEMTCFSEGDGLGSIFVSYV